MAGLNIGASRFFTMQKNVAASGTPERVMPYIAATTIGFTGTTITDSGNNLRNKGFFPGMRVTISGASNSANNKTVTIGDLNTDVVAGTMTLETDETLTTEAAGASVVIQPESLFTKVAPDAQIVVKAKFANTGTITIADSSDKALNTATFHVKLRNNEDVKMKMSDLTHLWMDATVSGDGVEVMFEW